MCEDLILVDPGWQAIYVRGDNIKLQGEESSRRRRSAMRFGAGDPLGRPCELGDLRKLQGFTGKFAHRAPGAEHFLHGNSAVQTRLRKLDISAGQFCFTRYGSHKTPPSV